MKAPAPRQAPRGEEHPLRLVVLSAGVSDPSSTRLLADRVAQRTMERLHADGTSASVSTIELAPLATDVARALVGGLRSTELQHAVDLLAAADALVVASPVYKAGVSGLLKSFVDLLDDDLLLAMPVALVATAGTARHALVVDDQLRPLFAFLRALAVPTSLFASPEDWADPALGQRVGRAAGELAALAASGVGRTLLEQGWEAYQHRFGGDAVRAQRTAGDVDLDTDLMRLATGGSASAARGSTG